MTDYYAIQPLPPAPRWQPLPPVERRVLGVLVEKAKTTPENYPLSLNARRQRLQSEEQSRSADAVGREQIEEALEQLAASGCRDARPGCGRVDKYRHLAYEWLGVEKVELAVMAELLLRGARPSASCAVARHAWNRSRTSPSCGRSSTSSHAKGLIQYLTPPGRGCVADARAVSRPGTGQAARAVRRGRRRHRPPARRPHPPRPPHPSRIHQPRRRRRRRLRRPRGCAKRFIACGKRSRRSNESFSRCAPKSNPPPSSSATTWTN